MPYVNVIRSTRYVPVAFSDVHMHLVQSTLYRVPPYLICTYSVLL